MNDRLFAIACVLCAFGAAAELAAAQPAAQHGHAGTHAQAPAASDSSFQREIRQAMRQMDAGMSIAHSGNPDRDFAAMMIPHHQGAVDMAKAELKFGRDPVLRRLAQGIIIEQQQEIDVMRRQLERLPPAPPTRAPARQGQPDRHLQKE